MQQTIYLRLMNKWEDTGYIGKIFCNTRSHARNVAYSVSVAMANRNKNKNIKQTTKPLLRQGTEPLTDNGFCCQLSLF